MEPWVIGPLDWPNRLIAPWKPLPLEITQNNFSYILKDNLEEIKHKNVQGVIFATQKYCEPYDYLFSIYKKMLDEQGIPVLRVVMSDSTDNRKLEFAVEAFADIL